MDANRIHLEVSQRRALNRLFALLLVVVGVGGTLAWLLMPAGPLSFNPVLWRDASVGSQELTDLRWRMHEDLIARQILVGRSRDQVIDLLGSPMEDTGSMIYYNLGTGRQFMPIDPYVLYIRFDDTDIAISVEVIKS